MRRLLRDVAEGRELGDTTTLADPAVVDELRERAASRRRRGVSAPASEKAGFACSVPEVAELEGDVEVLLLQGGDDRLQVVALLARDADLVALGLGLDALEAEVLDRLVDLLGVVGRDAGVQA